MFAWPGKGRGVDEGGGVLGEPVGLGPCGEGEAARVTGSGAEERRGQQGAGMQVFGLPAGPAPLADERKLRDLGHAGDQRSEVLLAQSGEVGHPR